MDVTAGKSTPSYFTGVCMVRCCYFLDRLCLRGLAVLDLGGNSHPVERSDGARKDHLELSVHDEYSGQRAHRTNRVAQQAWVTSPDLSERRVHTDEGNGTRVHTLELAERDRT